MYHGFPHFILKWTDAWRFKAKKGSVRKRQKSGPGARDQSNSELIYKDAH